MRVITLDKTNFKNVVESNSFVISYFWAEWCEPCKTFSPVFEQVAKLNEDAVFGMLDIDAEPELAQHLNITQIPCVVAIKSQIIIDGQVGSMPVAAFTELITVWRGYDISAIDQHFQKQSVEHTELVKL